jgi:hypothetical protein
MTLGRLRILAIPLRNDSITFYAMPALIKAEDAPAVQGWRWKVSEKWPADAKKMWTDLGEAPEGTFKSKIHSTGTRIMDNIPEEGKTDFMLWMKFACADSKGYLATEWFLKAVNSKPDSGELVMPAFLDPVATTEQLAALCRTKEPFHKRWRTLSIVCLPFSTAAGLLPGPNVFLLYNGTFNMIPRLNLPTTLLISASPLAFRLYSHHLAMNHAGHLTGLLTANALKPVSSAEMSKACDGWDRNELIPDKVLDTISEGLGDAGNDFYGHVDRARKQLRKKIAADKPSGR